MVLAMAFTVAAVLHISEVAFSSAPAANQHGFSDIIADAGDAPCTPDEDGVPHAAACGTVSNCPDLVSITAALLPRSPARAPDEMAASSIAFGQLLSPHEHPPRFALSA